MKEYIMGAYRGHLLVIPEELRAKHTLITGSTGYGKSTLATWMMLEDVRNGDVVVVLDPHSEAREAIWSRLAVLLPKHVKSKTWLIGEVASGKLAELTGERKMLVPDLLPPPPRGVEPGKGTVDHFSNLLAQALQAGAGGGMGRHQLDLVFKAVRALILAKWFGGESVKLSDITGLLREDRDVMRRVGDACKATDFGEAAWREFVSTLRSPEGSKRVGAVLSWLRFLDLIPIFRMEPNFDLFKALETPGSVIVFTVGRQNVEAVYSVFLTRLYYHSFLREAYGGSHNIFLYLDEAPNADPRLVSLIISETRKNKVFAHIIFQTLDVLRTRNPDMEKAIRQVNQHFAANWGNDRGSKTFNMPFEVLEKLGKFEFAMRFADPRLDLLYPVVVPPLRTMEYERADHFLEILDNVRKHGTEPEGPKIKVRKEYAELFS